MSQLVQRADDAELIDVGVDDWAHGIGAPALQRATEHMEGALAHEPATKVTDGGVGVLDRPHPDVHAPAGGEIVEPGSPVEELGALVGRDQIVPARTLVLGQQLDGVGPSRCGHRVARMTSWRSSGRSAMGSVTKTSPSSRIVQSRTVQNRWRPALNRSSRSRCWNAQVAS